MLEFTRDGVHYTIRGPVAAVSIERQFEVGEFPRMTTEVEWVDAEIIEDRRQVTLTDPGDDIGKWLPEPDGPHPFDGGRVTVTSL